MPNHGGPEFGMAASGGFIQLAPVPILAKRDPQNNDFAQAGQIWVNTLSDTVFICGGTTGGLAIWIASSQLLSSLTLNPGDLVVSAGNIEATAGNLLIGGTSTFDGAATVNNNLIVSPAAGIDGLSVTTLTTGISATLTSSGPTVDNLVLVGGGIKVDPQSSAAGASPRTVNARFGQAIFTTVIANGAYGTISISNSLALAASIVLANVSCATVNSALQIVEITPGAGSISLRIFNAGSASTAANILVNFWLMN